MAEVSRWKNVRVYVNAEFDEPHHLPHFHAELTDGTSAVYEIPSAFRLTEDAIKAEKEVQLWAREHASELLANWELLSVGQHPNRIAPYEKRSRKKAAAPRFYQILDYRIVRHGVIQMMFDDGTEKTIDFRPIMIGSVYGQLRDPQYFERVKLTHGHLEWPNGAGVGNRTLHDWSPEMEANIIRRFTEGAEVNSQQDKRMA